MLAGQNLSYKQVGSSDPRKAAFLGVPTFRRSIVREIRQWPSPGGRSQGVVGAAKVPIQSR